jgi:hypothetical protein
MEDYREFMWTRKIESIKRPVHYVTLKGVITRASWQLWTDKKV